MKIAAYPEVTIGAHSVSHPVMPKCTDEALAFEVAECKRSLESWTGKAVNCFAYPEGKFDGRERRFLIDSGYQLAATTLNAFITRDVDCFLTPRFIAGDSVSFPQAICSMVGIWRPVADPLKVLRDRAARISRGTRTCAGDHACSGLSAAAGRRYSFGSLKAQDHVGEAIQKSGARGCAVAARKTIDEHSHGPGRGWLLDESSPALDRRVVAVATSSGSGSPRGSGDARSLRCVLANFGLDEPDGSGVRRGGKPVPGTSVWPSGWRRLLCTRAECGAQVLSLHERGVRVGCGGAGNAGAAPVIAPWSRWPGRLRLRS